MSVDQISVQYETWLAWYRMVTQNIQEPPPVLVVAKLVLIQPNSQCFIYCLCQISFVFLHSCFFWNIKSVSIAGIADAYQTLSINIRPHFIWKLITARSLAMCDHLSWCSACLRVSELVNFRVNICSLEPLWDFLTLKPFLWKDRASFHVSYMLLMLFTREPGK